MSNKGLFVRLEAKSGKEAEVEEFLRSALPLVQQEPATTAWFAIRLGQSEFGIFDTFPDDAGRDAHSQRSYCQSIDGKREQTAGETTEH